ncbi:MAG: NAD(P)/FAD-dependent oxidoreductase [Christensenellales bacterium]
MRVVVIGGGAAGIFCAGLVAESGNECILLEKNERIGKKLYITGKGRCNITNSCSPREFLDNVVTNAKFLTSAIYKFSPQSTIEFLESHGVPVKTERGNRVFPCSDKANDVISAFEKFARSKGADIRLNTQVKDILVSDGKIVGVKTQNYVIACDKVIIATGGKSYSSTGSTGDGYTFAGRLGHNIVEPKPALSAIICDSVQGLAGLSLKNVRATAYVDGKAAGNFFGEMLFTHDGLSGPIILSLSSLVNSYYSNGKFTADTSIVIDLKPALDDKQLDARLLRDFSANSNCEIKNVLSSLMPKSLIPIVLSQAQISPHVVVNTITKAQRAKILSAVKALSFKATDLEKLDFAIVTKGGVDVSQVNPKDMQSKLVNGLYFAGEVLDVDAFTGGFNLQIALATGYAAAMGCIEK